MVTTTLPLLPDRPPGANFHEVDGGGGGGGKREASPRRGEGRRKSPQICTVTTADVEGGEPQTPVNPEKEYMEKGEGNLSGFSLLPPSFPEIIKASK